VRSEQRQHSTVHSTVHISEGREQQREEKEGKHGRKQRKGKEVEVCPLAAERETMLRNRQ
jgi:hypothetical protein